MKVKLSDAFELQMGKTPDRNDASCWNGAHKWVSIADITKADKYITETKETISDTGVSKSGIKQVPKGTVIMSFKLSIGKTAITTENLYTNEAIMAFIDKGIYDIDTDYIYHLFASKDWSDGTNKAVLGLTLNKATLSQIEIEIPSITEQKQAVVVLDKVDELISLRKKQLQKLDDLIKSRFVEMFGDINSEETKWETKPLGELCTIVRGGSPRPIEQYLGGTIPWIKIGDATEDDNIYLKNTKDFIVETGVLKSRLIKAGSLIFANCGVSLGFARIVTFDGCIHDGWLALENIDTKLDKVFLLYSLNSMTEHFRAIAPAGTQPNLNTAIMKAYRQIVPPLDLQKEYVSFCKQLNDNRMKTQHGLDKLEQMKQALMQKYFG